MEQNLPTLIHGAHDEVNSCRIRVLEDGGFYVFKNLNVARELVLSVPRQRLGESSVQCVVLGTREFSQAIDVSRSQPIDSVVEKLKRPAST